MNLMKLIFRPICWLRTLFQNFIYPAFFWRTTRFVSGHYFLDKPPKILNVKLYIHDCDICGKTILAWEPL